MSIPVWNSDTHTQWTVTPVTDSKSAYPGTPISLTGATGITVRFLPQSLPAFTGTGNGSIGTTTVNYVPSTADLTITGPSEVQISIQYDDGSLLPLQPLRFVIQPAI